MDVEYRVRNCVSADVDQLLIFVKELANFEKAPDAVIQTAEDYRRDAFEMNPPLFYFAFAERRTETGWEPIGFANWIYVYSTWKGRGLYLDDCRCPILINHFGSLIRSVQCNQASSTLVSC